MSNLANLPPRPKGAKPARVPAQRNAARGQECFLRIPGFCNWDPATTVDCHIRAFSVSGMAEKPDDVFIVWGCSGCHPVLDNRALWAKAAFGWDDLLRAFMLTLQARRERGDIILRGER